MIPKEYNLRSTLMLEARRPSYLDNCSCCMTGTQQVFRGNPCHPTVEEDWCMNAVWFDFHYHMSQYTCPRLPRMTNHHQLEYLYFTEIKRYGKM